MPDIYGFRQGPTYRPMTQADFWNSAMDQPLGWGATLGVAAKSGMLESFGLGTVARDIMTPSGNDAPKPTGNSYVDAVQGLDDLITPRNVFKRLAGTLDRSQPSMTEDAWKSSAYYRDGIPYDPAMTEQRAASLAYQFDQRKVRDFYTQKRPITSFIGQFAGQAADPINYIPIVGPEVKAAALARAGKIAGETLVGASEAVANTAIFGAVTAGTRQQFGDDVSWQAMLSDMAMAGLIGGAAPHVFHGIGSAIDAVRGRFTERFSTMENVQQARLALNEAVDGMVHQSEVRLGPNSIEPIERVAAEMDGLARISGIDQASTAEMPASLPEQRAVSVQADTQKTAPAATTVVTPEDVRALLDASGGDATAVFKGITDDVAKALGDGKGVTLTADGKQVTIVSVKNGMMMDANGQRWGLMSLASGNEKVGKNSLEISGTQAATPSLDAPSKPSGDTAIQPLAASEGGRPRMPAEISAARPIAVDNSAPRPEPIPGERKAAEARIAKTEDAKALADQYRVNPETGDFPEMSSIENLKAQGRLTEDDVRALEDAQSDFDNASAYGEALKSVVNCLL